MEEVAERVCRHCGFVITTTAKPITADGGKAWLCFDHIGCEDRRMVQCNDVLRSQCHLGKDHPYKHWNPIDGHWGMDRKHGEGKGVL